MNLARIYRTLGPLDWKNVRRDPLLAWALVLPLGLALLYRFGVPPLAAWLAARFAFDLTPYEPLLMGAYVLTVPTVVGMIVGFLLLDERDDQVLRALAVTPLPFGGYLLYRLTAPLLVGVVVTLAAFPLAGLVPLPPGDLLALALLAAPSAPAGALFLAAFAENKVTGLAFVKILNTINLLPVAAFFIPMPWQLAAGLVPAFWPMKVLWLAAAGEGIAATWLAGLLVNTAVLLLLLGRFEARLHAA